MSLLFYYNGTADFRKGAYGLSGLVRSEMQQDVLVATYSFSLAGVVTK
ncbi:MAG: hypothetical protein IPH58_17650 [Sphingobacteriales bacterium]|nr:hypothetical protein [Sphingobacteriales bacterium]